MTSLRVSALPNHQLDRIRDRGVDDFGNPLVISVNQDAGRRYPASVLPDRGRRRRTAHNRCIDVGG